MTNQEVAEILLRVAEFLECQKDNPYRVRAYRKAAHTISNTKKNIEEIAQEKGLQNLNGIGKDLANKIEEILATGTLNLDKNTSEGVPDGLSALFNVPGLPKETARFLFFKLKIQTLNDLEKLARSHLLRTLPGITKEKEQKILSELEKQV